MQIIAGMTVTGGRGIGKCVPMWEGVQRLGTPEPFEARCARLELLIDRKFSQGEDLLSRALEQLRRDMLSEMISRCDEFACAEDAVRGIGSELMVMLADSKNGTLRARVQDIDDICAAMLQSLNGSGFAPELKPGMVPVVENVSVFLALEAIRADAAGIISKNLNPLSHAALLLQGAGFPTAHGACDLNLFASGQSVLIDGTDGIVALVSEPVKPPESRDVHGGSALPNRYLLADSSELSVAINCNGSWEPLPELAEIGLLRTEFFPLALGRLPTESEFENEYSAIARKCARVTLRLIDSGADKIIPGLIGGSGRGIDLLLQNSDLLKSQLRAALRAFHRSKLRILLPYVEETGHLRAVREILRLCIEQLEREGCEYARNVSLGVMIETPHAAALASDLAHAADFASIGTNDLTQATLGISRIGNQALSANEAVLESIRHCVACFREANKPLCVCGALAATPEGFKELLSLGVRSISVPRDARSALHAMLIANGALPIPEDSSGALACSM